MEVCRRQTASVKIAGHVDPAGRPVQVGFAAFLAAAGVYGVMAYAVEPRKKELGLRMALGAGNASLMWLILGQGLVLATAGLAAGLAAAAGVSDSLRPYCSIRDRWMRRYIWGWSFS